MVVFPQRIMPLHARLISAGYSRETLPTYDWHGIRRKPGEFALIQHTLDGWGKLRYEQREFTVSRGKTMLLTMPHDHRYWLPRESSSWTFIFVCVAGRDAMGAWQQAIKQTGPVIRLEESSAVIRQLAATVREVLTGSIISPFQASARAYGLAMALLDGLCAPSPDRQMPPFLDDVIRHCREHWRQRPSVDELARLSGYSRYHFSRIFKAWTGAAPAQYVLDQSLSMSAAELFQSKLSIKESAANCGFPDANYFSRVFRKAFGMSPRQFRRNDS